MQLHYIDVASTPCPDRPIVEIVSRWHLVGSGSRRSVAMQLKPPARGGPSSLSLSSPSLSPSTVLIWSLGRFLAPSPKSPVSTKSKPRRRPNRSAGRELPVQVVGVWSGARARHGGRVQRLSHASSATTRSGRFAGGTR